MIVGIGLDLVELERLGKIAESEAGDRFAARVLTDAELALWRGLTSRRRIEFLAGRFAAKEAVVKALGCGIGAVVGFRDIELLPDAAGRPACRLSARAWAGLRLTEEDHAVHVAITHEKSTAAATAIIERR